MQRYGVRALSILDADYPQRLLNAPDAPIMLFYKGNADLNKTRTISIVGTRRNTEYGKQITEKIIRELAAYDVLIISGLAFGIDAIAHKTALKQDLSTVAVLAHGLASLYPPEHGQLSKQMLKQGGLHYGIYQPCKGRETSFPYPQPHCGGHQRLYDCNRDCRKGRQYDYSRSGQWISSGGLRHVPVESPISKAPVATG